MRIAIDETRKRSNETDQSYDALAGAVLPGQVADALDLMRRLLRESNLMAYLVNTTHATCGGAKVLKASGALYVHGDPTASHCLKAILDSIFGPTSSRTRSGAAALARVRWGDVGVRAATGDMNRARLRELGFDLGFRAEAGVSDEGAWFATAPGGAPVVLKWFPDETVADRYAVLLPGLDELRSRGVPVPEYPHVLVVDGWTLSAQQVLPGASVRNPAPAMVEQVFECVAAMAGVACPLPAPDLRPWGAYVVHTLTVGVNGWAMHEPLGTGGRRSAAVLDRVEAVGADTDPAWFPVESRRLKRRTMPRWAY